MKIGVISDTHNFINDRITYYLRDCDEIWHAGDFGSMTIADELEKAAPLAGVYGNIDDREIRQKFPEDLRLAREGFQIRITHIGGRPGKYEPRMKKEFREAPPDIFVTGHSHVLKVQRDKNYGFLYINPGAAGHSGFHKKRTLLLMEISKRKISGLRVVELGNR